MFDRKKILILTKRIEKNTERSLLAKLFGEKMKNDEPEDVIRTTFYEAKIVAEITKVAQRAEERILEYYSKKILTRSVSSLPKRTRLDTGSAVEPSIPEERQDEEMEVIAVSDREEEMEVASPLTYIVSASSPLALQAQESAAGPSTSAPEPEPEPEVEVITVPDDEPSTTSPTGPSTSVTEPEPEPEVEVITVPDDGPSTIFPTGPSTSVSEPKSQVEVIAVPDDEPSTTSLKFSEKSDISLWDRIMEFKSSYTGPSTSVPEPEPEPEPELESQVEVITDPDDEPSTISPSSTDTESVTVWPCLAGSVVMWPCGHVYNPEDMSDIAHAHSLKICA